MLLLWLCLWLKYLASRWLYATRSEYPWICMTDITEDTVVLGNSVVIILCSNSRVSLMIAIIMSICVNTIILSYYRRCTLSVVYVRLFVIIIIRSIRRIIIYISHIRWLLLLLLISIQITLTLRWLFLILVSIIIMIAADLTIVLLILFDHTMLRYACTLRRWILVILRLLLLMLIKLRLS